VQIPDPSIFEEDPMLYFDGKTICVTGEVGANDFHGGPEIVVTDPSQIVIQEEVEAVTYSWEEADTLMGKNVTICGPVISTASFSPPVVVMSVGAGSGEGLTVQIPDPSIFEEDPMLYFDGKTICVTGEVGANDFHGGPEILVTEPSQIVVQE